MSARKIKQDVKTLPEQGMIMEVDYKGEPKTYSGKVVVIVTGRFGNGVAQGICESYIQISNGKMLKARVEQVLCTKFMALSVEAMRTSFKDLIIFATQVYFFLTMRSSSPRQCRLLLG